jgi:hypothetical protein
MVIILSGREMKKQSIIICIIITLQFFFLEGRKNIVQKLKQNKQPIQHQHQTRDTHQHQ